MQSQQRVLLSKKELLSAEAQRSFTLLLHLKTISASKAIAPSEFVSFARHAMNHFVGLQKTQDKRATSSSLKSAQ